MPPERGWIDTGQRTQLKIAVPDQLQVNIAVARPENGGIATSRRGSRRSLEQYHAAAGGKVRSHRCERGVQRDGIENVLKDRDAQHQVESAAHIEMRQILN